ncbi:uncharacterized protein LOC135489648 [Lineus longissimus]|uniref:uncharacterized protein LOC135489648 n=1 Tax=Lineus longissimus TaxID=88925 RepID=UPI00315CB739
MNQFQGQMPWTSEWPKMDFQDFRSVINDPFFNDFLSLSDLQKPEAQQEKDWTIRLDVRGFKAENVSVRVSGEKVVVHAEQKDGDDYTVIKRHFPIADGVDVKGIKSKISPNGVLIVRCPYLNPELAKMQRKMNVFEELGLKGLDDSLLDRMQLNDDHKKRLKSLLHWGDVRCPSSSGVVNITKDEQGNKNYEIGFNLKEYEPEEIKLKMTGYKLTLDAKHVEDKPNHHVSRVIRKSVTLPETIDTAAVKSVMKSDRILRVSAPLLPEDSAKEIPICFENMLESGKNESERRICLP